MDVASMLRENLHDRPNIYQVLKEGCAMQGRDVPVHDVSVSLRINELILTVRRSTTAALNPTLEQIARNTWLRNRTKRQP
jgi:hypothetical protein